MRYIIENLNKLLLFSMLSISAFSISSCVSAKVEAMKMEPSGFLEGLWHGFILPFSLIGKHAFGMYIFLYDGLNVGFEYWAGYSLGIIGIVVIIGIVSRLLFLIFIGEL